MKFSLLCISFYFLVVSAFSQTTAPSDNLLLVNNPQKTLYFSNKGYTDASKVLDSLSILRGVRIILCLGTDIGIFKTYPIEKVPAGQKMLTYYKNINWKERRSDSTDVFLTKMHQNLKKESKEYADSAQWNNYLVINLSCLQYLYAGRDDNNEIETKWTHNTKSSTLGSVYVKSWGDLTLTDLKANNDKALLAWLKRLPLSVSWNNALPFKAVLDNTTQNNTKTMVLVKASALQKQIAQRQCKTFYYAGHGTNLQIQRETGTYNYGIRPILYKYLDTDAEIAQFVTDNPDITSAPLLPGAKRESQETNYIGNYIVSSDAGQYAGASVQVPLAEIDTWELLPEVREYVWLHQYGPFDYQANKQLLDNATGLQKVQLLRTITIYMENREIYLNNTRLPGLMVLSFQNQTHLVITDDLAQRNAKQQITISGDKGVLTW